MKIKFNNWKKFVNMFFSTTDFVNGSIAGWFHQNRHKHFFGTMLIGFVLMFAMVKISNWFDVDSGTYAASCFTITFFGWFVNAALEELQDLRTYNLHGYNSFDWGDIRWGTYGCFIGSLISLIITLKYFG